MRISVHKAICGGLVALAAITVPSLPALADNDGTVTPSSDTVNSTQADTSTSTTTDQPSGQSTAQTDTTATSTPNSLTQSDVNSANNTSPNGSQQATQTSDSTQKTSSTPANDPVASGKVGNTINSGAISGNADVTGNRTAGNATTGNAGASATVLNVANTSGASAGSFKTFNCDITQDLQQNIMIDPSSLQPLPYCTNNNLSLGGQGQQSAGGLQTGATLTDILNNVVLNATSGNAKVDDNTIAGSAKTGDAAALANVVNIANSNIGAANSFLGIVNIYGNLKGNILVPQSFVDSLIKDQANTNVTSSGNKKTTIDNEINASATSGNAKVDDNTIAGSAKTGDAATSLTVLNLTGQQVVAKNSLLVFVNVLGKWMGMIVPAPAGSTTAMLGGDVQGSSVLNASAPGIEGGDTTTNITNNITVNAQSGNADVTGNRKAGGATTGKAQAGVNLLNITDSSFWLQDWFGALFINVLGSWLGDFDIQANAPASHTGGGSSNPSQPIQGVKVYRITNPVDVMPANGTSGNFSQVTSGGSDGADSTQTIDHEITPAGVVLGDTQTPSDSSSGHHSIKLDMAALAAIVAALTLLIALATAGLRRRLAIHA